MAAVMDPQQELFTYLKLNLEEAFPGQVYDTFLPPEGTPYPFFYIENSTQNIQLTKSRVMGRVTQVIKVWHNDPGKRGTVSAMLHAAHELCGRLDRTDNYGWQIRDVYQRILPDNTTGTPLLMGILEVTLQFS